MSLPTEVLEDILSRLPVEPLLRFRCVSPFWRDLIDSPRFVKLHLNRSIETETNLNLMLKEDENIKPSLHAAKFDLSSLSLEPKEIDYHPLRDDDYGIHQVWGSCNGLICLGNVSFTTVVLWNPSTRRSVTLPFTEFDCKKEKLDLPISHYRRTCSIGFGYDRVGNDYKVVRTMHLARIDSSLRVYDMKVYSLKAHSWHNVDQFYDKLPYISREPGQVASNVLHWMMRLDRDKLGEIVELDLHSEKCRIVPKPKLEDNVCDLSLEVYRGSICLVSLNRLHIVDLLVMKEYGVEESWTKLVSIAVNFTRPFYFPLKNGGVWMQHDHKLLWFDFDTEKGKSCFNMKDYTNPDKVRNLEVRGLKNFDKVDIFIGSLVPLGPFSELNDKKKLEEKRKNDMSGFLSKGFKLKL